MSTEEIILETRDVRVRIIQLEPGETAPVHCHSQVTDNMFGLSGEILIRMRNPDERCILTAGTRCTVQTGRYHQVLNNTSRPARYLLVQGVGKYDFLVEGR